MSQLKLVAISQIKTEKDRSDSKISRQYYTAEFSNPANPFGKTVKRTFWQQHSTDGLSAEWRGGNPSEVKAFIGKLLPGKIVSSQVEAYDIADSLGNIREANTFTTVVLDGENNQSVFKSAGKTIVEVAETIVSEAKEAF